MRGEKAMLNDNENVQMNMTADEPSMLHENMLPDSTIQTVMGWGTQTLLQRRSSTLKIVCLMIKFKIR